MNEASDIELLPSGQQRLTIEMQSGDVLSLEAKSIQLSSTANLPSEITSRIVHEARKGRYVDDFSVDELK